MGGGRVEGSGEDGSWALASSLMERELDNLVIAYTIVPGVGTRPGENAKAPV